MANSTDRIGVAVIGAGGWGKNLVRSLASIGCCELRYVCDLREEILAANRKLYPAIQTTPDINCVLGDDEVDAVLVAVDVPRHFEVASACLRARKHTFVEKPLALTVGDASALVELADAAGVKLMVGHLLLYHPAVLMLRDFIDKGELGELLYVYSQRLNLGIVRQIENAWWSLAPHDVSIALFLLGGRASSVAASGQCFLQPKLGLEDVVFASVKFDNGRLAHIHVSWLDPHKTRRITVVGTKKMAVFDDMEATEKLRVFDKGAEVRPDYVDYAEAVRLRVGNVHIPALPGEEPLRCELLHFLDAIANDSTLRTDGRNGLEVVRVLVAGEQSLKDGGTVVEIREGST